MFDNKFFLGVGGNGYVFLHPPRQGTTYSDDDMAELAALIVVMKPGMKEKFDGALKRMQG